MCRNSKFDYDHFQTKRNENETILGTFFLSCPAFTVSKANSVIKQYVSMAIMHKHAIMFVVNFGDAYHTQETYSIFVYFADKPV